MELCLCPELSSALQQAALALTVFWAKTLPLQSLALLFGRAVPDLMHAGWEAWAGLAVRRQIGWWECNKIQVEMLVNAVLCWLWRCQFAASDADNLLISLLLCLFVSLALFSGMLFGWTSISTRGSGVMQDDFQGVSSCKIFEASRLARFECNCSSSYQSISGARRVLLESLRFCWKCKHSAISSHTGGTIQQHITNQVVVMAA